MAKPFIIAIDGTAASGKGTLARALAERLRLAHMDTGTLYRLVAVRLMEAGGHPDDRAAAIAQARMVRQSYRPSDSQDPALRTDRAGPGASKVSAIAEVRSEMTDLQRNFAVFPPLLPDGTPPRGAVLDGRDIGTVICPDAAIKFFVTADTAIRAQRRYKELQSQGILCTYEAVLADMRERDARDAGRETAPMKPAPDAIILDTGTLSAQDVLDKALSLIREKYGDAIFPNT